MGRQTEASLRLSHKPWQLPNASSKGITRRGLSSMNRVLYARNRLKHGSIASLARVNKLKGAACQGALTAYRGNLNTAFTSPKPCWLSISSYSPANLDTASSLLVVVFVQTALRNKPTSIRFFFVLGKDCVNSW